MDVGTENFSLLNVELIWVVVHHDYCGTEEISKEHWKVAE